jgi:hypothetical protein
MDRSARGSAAGVASGPHSPRRFPMALFGRGDPPMARYRMKQRAFSIGDDYWVEDAEGRRAFKVDGKVMRIRRTFVLKDPAGNELAHD